MTAFRRSQRASRLLLAWDGATGWTPEGQPVTRDGVVGSFSRSTVKRAVDRNGRLYTVPPGRPAITHGYNPASGLFEPAGALLGNGGTNICLRSQEFDNASWSKGTGITITANDIVAPDGTLTADRLNNDASVASQSASQVIAFTGNAEKCAAVYLKAGTATQTDLLIHDSTAAVTRHGVNVAWSGGVPTLSTQAGAGVFALERLADGWYRVLMSAAGVIAANTNSFNIYPTGTGQLAGNVYAWGAHVENRPFPLSYIATTTASATLGIDLWSLPFLRLPGDLTVYLDMVDFGVCQEISNSLLLIGSTAGNSSCVSIRPLPNVGDVRIATLDATPTQKNVDLTSGACAFGDRQEIRAAILAAGIHGGRSLNGAAELTAGPAAAQAHPATYASGVVTIPSSGNEEEAIRAIKIAIDDHTMSWLRAA